MRRIIVVVTAVLASLVFAAPAAWAGSPHFVSVTATTSGNTLTVSGK